MQTVRLRAWQHTSKGVRRSWTTHSALPTRVWRTGVLSSSSHASIKVPAVYSPTHGNDVYRITLSRCGTLCAVGYCDGHITVFDTTTAAVVADLTHGSKALLCTAFSVCGTWLATCSRDCRTICVWLTSTWEQVCILHHNNSGVGSAGWTHCGRLVSGDHDGEVRVWDLKGTPSATVLEGHSTTVHSIAVSGTRIFSGSRDRTIRVWDISTLTHTHTLDGHTGWVFDLALTQDEQHLVSCPCDKCHSRCGAQPPSAACVLCNWTAIPTHLLCHSPTPMTLSLLARYCPLPDRPTQQGTEDPGGGGGGPALQDPSVLAVAEAVGSVAVESGGARKGSGEVVVVVGGWGWGRAVLRFQRHPCRCRRRRSRRPLRS